MCAWLRTIKKKNKKKNCKRIVCCHAATTTGSRNGHYVPSYSYQTIIINSIGNVFVALPSQSNREHWSLGKNILFIIHNSYTNQIKSIDKLDLWNKSNFKLIYPKTFFSVQFFFFSVGRSSDFRRPL